jgi:hypothetical protein
LQTEKKDFGFYGTLFNNFREVSRSASQSKVEIRISFDGDHKRRSDQTSASNLQVASWLTEQTGRKIIGISEKDRDQIKGAIRASVLDSIFKTVGKVTIS